MAQADAHAGVLPRQLSFKPNKATSLFFAGGIDVVFASMRRKPLRSF
jgi:hypothetical protein